MKHYVYLMNGSEEKLIFMEEQDNSGLVIYSIDYQTNPPLERRVKYFDLLLLEDTDVENGVEIGKLVYEYDYNKRIISQKRFTNDFLVEQIHTEYIENITITSRIENGIVIERTIEKEYDNGSKTTEFYDFGELFEIQEEVYHFEANTYVTKVFNADNELISTFAERVDDQGRLLSLHEISADGNPMVESIYTIENDKLIKINFNNYSEEKFEVHFYSYDEFGNEIEILVENSLGTKIGFHSTFYNETGTVVEEKGVFGAYFNSFYPRFLHPSTKEYHLVHKYEE